MSKGYQYLENDFFDLCNTRNIRAVPMLLYIYLRGLYCRFQNSAFFCKDKQIQGHLGLSHKTLQRARLILQERGLINTEDIISHRFALDKITAAMAAMDRPDRNKVVIVQP